jgi:hypothetical protein
MKIAIRYLAQIKIATGRAGDELELSGPRPVREVVTWVAERFGEPLRRLLLTDGGDVQPTLLLFLGEDQVEPNHPAPRFDGEVLTILSPMAGG